MLSETEIRRLRWRTRRGMLELDVLLEPFFEEAFQALSEAEQYTFVELLEYDDTELLSWFQHKTKPDDPKMESMVQMILDRNRI